MSSARQAAAARTARAPRVGTRPRRVSHGTRIRVRWDRAGRTGLLAVLIVVAGLYVQQGFRLLSTHTQAQHQLDVVQQLARQNRQLAAQQRSLNDPTTIQQDARALGMVRPGERPYVVTGLSNH